MHGFARRNQNRSRIYRIWAGMKSRCRNPNVPCYKNYGARGIGYDPQWEMFETFLADMGEPSDGLTLERRDNDKNYGKDNCYWATRATQSRNTRRTKKPDGVTCLKDIATAHDIRYGTLNKRLTRGVSLKDAISMGPGGKRRKSSLRIAAEAVGIKFSTVSGRIKKSGLSVKEALTLPLYATLRLPRKNRT